jgi:predicted AAA+ superfamily ATPase
MRRALYDVLMRRLCEPRRSIQVLAGPRQVGKTTLVQGLIDDLATPTHYASADEPRLQERTWLEQQWDQARLLAGEQKGGAILVLDEIQKIPNWPGNVKLLWDTDTRKKVPLKVVLLGSAPLLIQRGLTESLAGRFEVIRAPHWSFSEMRDAFGWSLQEYLYYGGYPGSAGLIGEPDRWRYYIRDSLVETTLSRDILLMTRVDKPALLRRMFDLACDYSGQILSYQKMLGQLMDAGNTVTLAHYLELLGGAGMVTGLQKFSPGKVHSRGSSPKLQVLNTALMTAHSDYSLTEMRRNPELWGRLVESAVGAHLLNTSHGASIEVSYWRDRNMEVDFVLHQGRKVVPIEVKSGRSREILPGMEAFSKAYKPLRKLLVGGQGIELEEFLMKPAAHWFS